MLKTRHSIHLALTIALIFVISGRSRVTGQQCSSFSSQTISNGATLNVFTYTCTGIGTVTSIPPSTPVTVQELAISPNLFTVVPYTQLCKFNVLISLIMSNNRITSLTNAFKSSNLGCLTALSKIDFSSNQISSPLVATDFDDSFAAQLVSLNLTGNNIPYLNSDVFLKSDNTSRFPNLQYLGLAFNRLTTFDLLWPLSLPSSNLRIDIQSNPIESLTNQLQGSFSDTRFSFAMTGQRFLNLQNNRLQHIDDTDLLIFNLKNAFDFRAMIRKMLNYDFRQSNGVVVFFCYCFYGTKVVSWYLQMRSQLPSGDFPIYNIYCKNFFPVTYIFDWGQQCNITASNDTNPGTDANTVTSSPDNAASLAASSGVNSNLFLLFLLFIPLILLLFLLFICLCGRCCQVAAYHWFRLLFCPCFRPDDENRCSDKCYDAVICYNREDKYFVEQLISEICLPKNNYKIHKQAMGPKNCREPYCKDNEKILRRAKRIILIYSKEFVDTNMSNTSFVNILRDIYHCDPNCVLIAVNKDVERKCVKSTLLNKIESPKSPEERGPLDPNQYWHNCCWMLYWRFRHNCGLNRIEILDYNDRSFYRKFHYIMPIMGYDETKPTIITRGSKNPNDSFEYASDYKNVANLRHIIVPIPEFMRTKLGFNKKNQQHQHSSSDKKTTADNHDAPNSMQINPLKSLKYASGHAASDRPRRRSLRDREAPPVVWSAAAAAAHAASAAQAAAAAAAMLASNNSSAGGVNNKSYQSMYHSNSLSTVNAAPEVQRSETPHILAMFAPAPNTVVHIDKQRSRGGASGSRRSNKQRSSSTDYPGNIAMQLDDNTSAAYEM